MKKILVLLFIVVGLSSCATITPRASGIMLHSQISSQLDSCKRVGPVTAEASCWGVWSKRDCFQQAKNNLREAAIVKYGEQVDSVALINMDEYSTAVVAHGIAFKCF